MPQSEDTSDPDANQYLACPSCGEDQIQLDNQGVFEMNTYVCADCGYEAEKNEVKISFSDIVDEKRERKDDSDSTPNEAVRQLAEGAKHDSVTPERLMGTEQYFHNVLPYLEPDEQPHYLFPLTKGLFADSSLVIESGAEERELLKKQDGGSVVISDVYVRIVSNKGEWTIPYSSISSVDFVGHPALHIHSEGRTYYIKIAGTFFDEEENLSECASYIRNKQRYHSGESGEGSNNQNMDNPIEQIERLSELAEKDIISEEEFESKKSELMEKI